MTLDIEKVEAALKRAAHIAVHGTREQRAGRFLPARDGKPSKAENAPKARDKRLR